MNPLPDLDTLFTYHAPTAEQAPKYLAIRQAETEARDVIATIHANLIGHYIEKVTPATYASVNDACKQFARAVCDNCPGSADTSAAVRCIRLARNAMNEVIAGHLANEERGDIFDVDYLKHILGMAGDELLKARWQASSAIALEGK